MNDKIAILGLGYVGLPLAQEFSRFFDTIGYDIDLSKIENYKLGLDEHEYLDVTNNLLNENLKFTNSLTDIAGCNIFIITVPTPITKTKEPDLSFLFDATHSVSQILKKGDIVIYESTVYPGCTEEDCVPILEKSKLKFNEDFYCGYSPERINPGDKRNTLTKIVKVTSGSNDLIAEKVDNLYKKIITAGTHKASSIKVAEASKAIENAQRDLNISFMNELSLIFDKMGIDTYDVIDAASTKWNFMNFSPGLVGGHCISVDPYYLAFKSKSLGYFPEVILSGRKVNDHIPSFVSSKIIMTLSNKGVLKSKAKVLILGITFKENFSDIRNTKVPIIYKELLENNVKVDIYDKHANHEEVNKLYGIKLLNNLSKKYHAIIITVPHDEFLDLKYEDFIEESGFIFDLKNCLKRNDTLKL
jgi:UDP-N-acetyl-D-galactosamine dehydrogenase